MYIASGQHIYVKSCGDYYSKDFKLKLKDVKSVNTQKQGLISVTKLTDCGYIVIFGNSPRVSLLSTLLIIKSTTGCPPLTASSKME